MMDKVVISVLQSFNFTSKYITRPCDIRPNMKTEEILKDNIKTIDNLFCEDLGRNCDLCYDQGRG